MFLIYFWLSQNLIIIFFLKKENNSIIKSHTISTNTIETEQKFKYIDVELFLLKKATNRFFENVTNIYTYFHPTRVIDRRCDPIKTFIATLSKIADTRNIKTHQTNQTLK